MTLYPCDKCGSPTRSHIVGRAYICHKCWVEMGPEEIEKMKQKAEELERIQRNAILKRYEKMITKGKKKKEYALSENVTLVDDSK